MHISFIYLIYIFIYFLYLSYIFFLFSYTFLIFFYYFKIDTHNKTDCNCQSQFLNALWTHQIISKNQHLCIIFLFFSNLLHIIICFFIFYLFLLSFVYLSLHPISYQIIIFRFLIRVVWHLFRVNDIISSLSLTLKSNFLFIKN